MNIDMIPFFTPAVQNGFWQNLKAVLYVGMPLLMIWLAVQFSEEILTMLVNVFRHKNSDEDYGENDYDDKKNKY